MKDPDMHASIEERTDTGVVHASAAVALGCYIAGVLA
jgi:hypothetical protein